MNEILAVIFDMDGVILDSESICDITWEMTRKEFNLPAGTDAIDACRGTNRTDSCIILRKIFGQDMDAEKFLDRSSERFREIEFSSGIPLMPFAKEILEYLKPKYRLALASSTKGPTVLRQLTNAGVIDFFETRTTGETVLHSKPDPEIYLKACESLGLRPAQCAAVEDSPNGAKSAIAAGMRAILVPDKTKSPKELMQKCWKVCDSLKDLTEFL